MDELERTVTAESTNAADAGPKVSAQSSFVFVCFSPCRQSYPIIIVVHRHVEFSEIARTFVYRPWGTMIAFAITERAELPVHRNKTLYRPCIWFPHWQQVGPQHAAVCCGFTARTKALMNFPSTWGAMASRSMFCPDRNSRASSTR